MFQSQDEFSRQNLWGQGGAGQTRHNRGGDPKAEGDRGYADEETGLLELELLNVWYVTNFPKDFLEKKIESEVATARKNAKTNKRAALQALKRKKR